MASVRICSDDHNHSSNGRHLRSMLGPHVVWEASEIVYAGGHSLGALVLYMEVKHGLRIKISSLRRRIEAQRESAHPRATDAARIIQNL